METKARINNISRDFQTGKVIISFIVDHYDANEVDRLMKGTLRLKAVHWREKRSLDANGYFWVICDKMAAVLNTSKDELYEILLDRYGTLLTDDEGKPYTITVSSALDISKVEGHFKKIKDSSDGRFTAYAVIKGSSDYDSAEMSRLIDGTVSEAKELGIETLPPEELERIKRMI